MIIVQLKDPANPYYLLYKGLTPKQVVAVVLPIEEQKDVEDLAGTKRLDVDRNEVDVIG